MKRFQPFYYIVLLAGLFLAAGLTLFILDLLPRAESTAVTVDPQTQNGGEVLYDLWFSSVEVHDLSIDHNLSKILFSTGSNTVSLLDRDRRLLWDQSFSSAPHQAKLSSCGNYAVIGTAGGRLLYTSTGQEIYWEDQGDPVEQVAISPTASWVAAVRALDEDLHYLQLYNQHGEQQWSINGAPIHNLFLTSEYLEQANVYFTRQEKEQAVIAAVGLDGETLWSYEGQCLAAVSRHGSRLAATRERDVIVYDSLGYVLWEATLPFDIKNVIFNPQNYNRILVYGSREGARENLYYFDLAEELLWMGRIADGSLFSFTADGQHIITSSWKHYREDYTQMILLDRDGNEINTWEVAMRVDRLVTSGHPHLIVVCGEDGYIDLIDIKLMLAENGNDHEDSLYYSPVTTVTRPDETRISLYFIDENANLVPVTRTISATDNPLRAALEELVRGPARGSTLYRTIPDKDFPIEMNYNANKGSLSLELSPELIALRGSARSAAFESLLLTVSSFPEITEIHLMTEDKEPLELTDEDHKFEQPLDPRQWEKPIFVPIKSGNRYYLYITEASREDEQTIDLQGLVEQVLRVGRGLAAVPSDLSLLSLDLSAEHARINLNDSFKLLFSEAEDEESRALAALILDAIFITVFENSSARRAEILVDGEKWSSPAGYPSTSRFFRQPYFINPES